ncbi:hypothetical protein quinque_009788 [Culex quinquefasciatus]
MRCGVPCRKFCENPTRLDELRECFQGGCHVIILSLYKESRFPSLGRGFVVAVEGSINDGRSKGLGSLNACPTTSGDNTIATEVVPTLAEVRRGSSNQAAQCSSADVTSEFSGGMEIVVAATENTERNSLAASKLSDVADTAMMPEKTIGEEEEGFQLVQYGVFRRPATFTSMTVGINYRCVRRRGSSKGTQGRLMTGGDDFIDAGTMSLKCV